MPLKIKALVIEWGTVRRHRADQERKTGKSHCSTGMCVFDRNMPVHIWEIWPWEGMEEPRCGRSDIPSYVGQAARWHEVREIGSRMNANTHAHIRTQEMGQNDPKWRAGEQLARTLMWAKCERRNKFIGYLLPLCSASLPLAIEHFFPVVNPTHKRIPPALS